MSRDFDLTPPTLEQRARRRVALKTGFYVHATVFALVNGGLFLMSWIGGWGEGWGHGHRHGLVFPLWGWGLGLTIHGIVVLLRLKGGITQAESPEWMPASSMCSMMAPRTAVSPSQMQSTSTSVAFSKKWSTSTG